MSLGTGPGRLPTLDALRGVAICGILLVNIWVMGSVPGIYLRPSLGGWSALDQLVWWFQSLFVEGAMRGLLSVLFGAGFVLMTTPGKAGGAGRFYRRAFVLIVMGLVHAFLLLWPGDILFMYGAAALFLYPLRTAEPRQLIGGGVAILMLLAGLGVGAKLETLNLRIMAESAAMGGAAEDDGRITAWQDHRTQLRPPSANDGAAAMAARRGTLGDNLDYKAEQSLKFADPSALLYMLGDCLGMMLIGAGLMRLGLLQERSPQTHRRMMIWGYALGVLFGVADHGPAWASEFMAVQSQPSLLTEPARLAMTIGHVGALMSIWQTGRGRQLLCLFAPAGRLALTNYIGQTLICQWLLFPGFGLGLYAQFSIAQLWAIAVAIIAAQIIFSRVWLKRFRHGPLEWLLRTGTYLRRP